MCHCQDNRVIRAMFRVLHKIQAVFVAGLVRVSPRIERVYVEIYSLRARTTSTTFVLRKSGVFSLKVKLRTRTLLLGRNASILVMCFTKEVATYSPMPSFSRRPARMISG